MNDRLGAISVCRHRQLWVVDCGPSWQAAIGRSLSIITMATVGQIESQRQLFVIS